MDHLPAIVGILTSIVAAPFLFRLFFDNFKDFLESVGYAFKPDFLSWMDKELHRDYSKSMKLGMFILMSAAPGCFAM
jgi:hypothetical protein